MISNSQKLIIKKNSEYYIHVIKRNKFHFLFLKLYIQRTIKSDSLQTIQTVYIHCHFFIK